MKQRGFWFALVLLLSVVVASPTASAAPVSSDEPALVRVRLPNAAMFDELVANGADIAARPRSGDGRLLVDLVLTGSQLADLNARGVRTVQVIEREGDAAARYTQSQARTRQAAADTLH